MAGFELPLDGAWFTGMVAYAEAAIECADPALAGPIFKRLEPWVDQLSYTGTTVDGPISHYLGGLAAVLDCHEDAARYFAHADTFCERIGAKYSGAMTRYRWGTLLCTKGGSGDTELGHGLLRQAHAGAVANGYKRIERRSAEALGEKNRSAHRR
jgi:hypothetical protein